MHLEDAVVAGHKDSAVYVVVAVMVVSKPGGGCAHRNEARLLVKARLVSSPFAQKSFLRTVGRDVRRSGWCVFVFPPRGP